jgi:hypothetical protein
MMNWKGCGRERTWPTSRYYPDIRLKRQRETMKNFSYDSQCPNHEILIGLLKIHIRKLSQIAHCCVALLSAYYIYKTTE